MVHYHAIGRVSDNCLPLSTKSNGNAHSIWIYFTFKFIFKSIHTNSFLLTTRDWCYLHRAAMGALYTWRHFQEYFSQRIAKLTASNLGVNLCLPNNVNPHKCLNHDMKTHSTLLVFLWGSTGHRWFPTWKGSDGGGGGDFDDFYAVGFWTNNRGTSNLRLPLR